MDKVLNFDGKPIEDVKTNDIEMSAEREIEVTSNKDTSLLTAGDESKAELALSITVPDGLNIAYIDCSGVRYIKEK